MKIKIINFVSAVLLASSQLFAQDLCTPVGWATQNGGTTGGGNATPTVVSNYAALKAALTSATVKVVHIQGTITFPMAGRINIQDVSGKTIFGLPGSKMVSVDMTADGSGIFYIKRSNNLIFRNLYFEGPGAYDTDGNDNMTIDNCQNVWVDHCEFHDGMDGNLDIKNASDYISVTWTKFSYEKPPKAGGPGGAPDHRYSNLFGSSDGATGDRGKLRITMQYCWWAEGCKERMPRVRFGKVHMVNNYFSSSVANQGIRAAFEADILAEGNFFIPGYAKPIDEFEKTYTAILSRNNTGAANLIRGTAFTPPYNLAIAASTSIVTPITTCAGAKLPSPTGCSSCNNGSINKEPVVNITSPITNSNFTVPASILFKAKATDSDGIVTKVEFFQGSTKIGEDLTGVAGEYTFSWTNVAAGSYTITARATDDDGATKFSTAIVINVKAPVLVPPTVTLTSPLNGASDKSPATFAFAATASDVDGTISKVEFWGRRGGTTTNVLLGSDATSPYTFNWQNITAEGGYFVFAKAIDDDGLETNSTIITISVLPKNVAPVVSISAPINNATFIAPADIILTVNATDSDGKITKVEYFNGTTKLGEDLVTPFSYSIIDLPVGTYTLTAKATDSDGAVTTSTVINVKVNAPVLVPPVVTLNTPTASQVFTTPATVLFTATASLAGGTISKVEFWGRKGGTSNVVLLGSDPSAPFAFNWVTSEIGGYEVYAKAYGSNGQIANSTVINISVKAPNVLPSVSFSSPVANEVVDLGSEVVLEVNATDVDGTVEKVEFFRGSTLIATDKTEPFIYTWSGLGVGSYTVTARAFDNEGGAKFSTAVTFVVKAVITGVENDNIIENKFIISPNPFNESLNVSLDSQSDVEISDLNGKIVFNGAVEKETINTSNWKNGLYIIKLKTNNKVFKFSKVQ